MPWKLQVVGEQSFKIIVPSVNGRLDYRVELNKIGYMLKKKMASKSDHDDDDDDTNISHHEDELYSDSSSCQAFEFRCVKYGELSIYAQAAQTLERILYRRSEELKKKILIGFNKSGANVRTRTAESIQLSAQSAKLDRRESAKAVKIRRMSSIGDPEYRCFPLYCYPDQWITKKDLAYELGRTSKTFHDFRKGTPDEIGWLDVEVST